MAEMYRTAGMLLSASVVRYAGQLAVLVLLARLAGPGSVGQFTVALAVCAPVYILAGFGIRTVHLTLPVPLAPQVCERFLLGALGTAAAVIALLAVLLPPEIGVVVALVALIRTGETLAELYGAMLQRAGRPGALVGAVASGVVLQTAAVALVLLRGGPLPFALSASALVYGLSLLLVMRPLALRASARDVVSRPRRPGQWRLLFAAGLPTGIAIGMLTLLSTVPQYLLGAGGEIADAGRFAVLLYTVVAVETVLHALAQSWIPHARTLRAEGLLGLSAVVRTGLRWTLLAGAPGLAGLALAAWILPAVLGPDFAVTPSLAAPLACAILLVPGAFAADTAVVVRNRYSLSMTVSVCALACGSALGAVLLLRGEFGLIAALWTFAGTMAVRAAGGFAAAARAAGGPRRGQGRSGQGRSGQGAGQAVKALCLRYWVLVPIGLASAAAVLAGPQWVLGGTALAVLAVLLLLLRVSAAELLVLTAPLAFYATAGGMRINLAVSDALLLLLLVRVLLDPSLRRTAARTAGAVRLALSVLALLLSVHALTILVRSGGGAPVDWIAFAADAFKLVVVLGYFCVCLVVFHDLLARGDLRFLRLWALTAAVVGALGTVGALLFAAGTETGLTMDFRATGTFEDPNAFATYLIVSVPLTLLGRVLSGRSLLSWHLVPILAGVIASFSRGALVGLAAVLLLLCAAAFRLPALRVLRYVSLAAVAVAGVLVAQGTVDSLFESNRGVGFGEDVRFRLWAAAVELWLHSPVCGVGMGQFVVSSEDLLGAAGGVLAHNTFLSVLAEGGVVGAGLFAAVPAAVLLALLRRGGAASVLLLIACAGAAVMALSLNLQNFRPLWMLLALSLAHVLAPAARSAPEAGGRERGRAPVPGLGSRPRVPGRSLLLPTHRTPDLPTARTDMSWT
jgi:O-antigen/teichoic acid export membrane protein/O-antigen ligase